MRTLGWGVAVLLSGVLMTGCGQPDTPSNAAIGLLVALQLDNRQAAISFICDQVVGGRSGDELAADGWGPFAGLLAADGSALGEDAEYTPSQELELEVDHAWSEYEFGTGVGVGETWRLHMVREDGRWKVCDAELRP